MKVVTFDAQVDTTRKPARSIWLHPHDDSLFLRSHPQYKMTDEIPSPEKKGVFGKIKASTFGRAANVRQNKERQDQENILREVSLSKSLL
jgi:hypothetical protein